MSLSKINFFEYLSSTQEWEFLSINKTNYSSSSDLFKTPIRWTHMVSDLGWPSPNKLFRLSEATLHSPQNQARGQSSPSHSSWKMKTMSSFTLNYAILNSIIWICNFIGRPMNNIGQKTLCMLDKWTVDSISKQITTPTYKLKFVGRKKIQFFMPFMILQR